MGGFRIVLLLCAALLAGAILSVQAADTGKVLFVRPTGDPQNTPADVYEKDLKTGDSKLLISHKSLPESFQTRIAAVNPSPNGQYVQIDESPGWVIRNTETGSTRVMFGYGFSYNKDEEVVDTVGEGHWCWERKTGIIKMICPNSGYEDVNLTWSPQGDYLLITDSTDGCFNSDSTSEGFVQVYDPAAGKLYDITKINNLGIAVWSGKGDGIIEVTYSQNGTSTVYIQPINGKPRTLFTWPKIINDIAMSSDGKTCAIFDGYDYYLTDSNGRKLSTLKIPMQQEGFEVDLSFNRSGTSLAVATYFCFGEPHVNQIDQLWSVDVEKRQAKRIAEWREYFQGSGQAVDRCIAGWLPDDKSIVIKGSIYYGFEKPADNEHDWCKVWSYDMLTPTGKGEVLFDSGKNCLAAGYCPGK